MDSLHNATYTGHFQSRGRHTDEVLVIFVAQVLVLDLDLVHSILVRRVTRRISPTIRRVPVRQDSNPPGAESRRMLNPPGRASIRRVPARRVSDPAGAGPPGAAEAQDTMGRSMPYREYCSGYAVQADVTRVNPIGIARSASIHNYHSLLC